MKRYAIPMVNVVSKGICFANSQTKLMLIVKSASTVDLYTKSGELVKLIHNKKNKINHEYIGSVVQNSKVFSFAFCPSLESVLHYTIS